MRSSVGVRVMAWRLPRVTAILAFLLICVACGDQFRPVAIPITPPPPNPEAAHNVFVLSDNGVDNPGASSQLDVSGDTNIGVARLGLGPAHAALTPNGSRIYVVNRWEDTVSSYASGSATSVTTTSLPTGSRPVFVNTTEAGTVYVANSGTNTVAPTVAAISTTSNFLLDPQITLEASPVALAETPDGKKLYAVKTNGTVTSINTLDRSVGQVIATGSNPVWAVARSDSARVYVLNSGSGTVSAIDTSTDTLLPASFSVGAGASFMIYDGAANRIYATNPTANTVTALDVSSDPPAVPLFTTAVAASPVTVTALPDRSRLYVASAALSNGNVSAQVTVLNALDGSIQPSTPSAPNPMPLTAGPIPAICDPNTRFRLFIASAADSSRVYVGNCDAGNTTIIRTSDNTQVLNMPAPLSDFPGTSLQITSSAQSGSTTTYTYSTTSGPALRMGIVIVIRGMADAGNNGTFTINGLGNGTFAVSNLFGVTASGQSGTAVAAPPQNPVFVLAGP
jgi:DNA-binding beta-propeller fold protein YncE